MFLLAKHGLPKGKISIQNSEKCKQLTKLILVTITTYFKTSLANSK
jgi:hypothetical protein